MVSGATLKPSVSSPVRVPLSVYQSFDSEVQAIIRKLAERGEAILEDAAHVGT